MPPAEHDAIKADLDDLKRDVRDSLAGMRSDLKDLAKALHELIRLDGDLGRVADLTNRIGKQVDEIAVLWRTDKAEIDRRLSALEINLAGNNKSVGMFDGVVKYSLTLMVGLALGVTVMKVVA